MKKLILLISVLSLLLLSGCSAVPEGTEPGPDPTDPTHIYEEIREGLRIDAQVMGAPEGKVPKIYAGHHQEFTREQIDAFLEAVGDPAASYQEREINGYLVRSMDCASGKIFHHQYDISGLYPGSTAEYTDRDALKWYQTYPIYWGQSDYDNSAAYRFTDMFLEPESYPFATPEAAEAAVRNALDKLGLPDLYLNRTLYLGHQRMEAAGRRLEEENWVMEDDEPFPQREDWSEADDCYLFEFFFTIDGIPMAYQDFDFSTSLYNGGNVLVYYNQSGIIGLNIWYPWCTDTVVSEPERILSAEDAMGLAKEKLVNVVSSGDTVVDRIALEYMFKEDGSRWLLTPVWCVSLRKSSSWDPTDFTYEHILIDAVTGEEI